MSSVGVSVVGPERNGYGPLCEAKPAVVIAVNEGGALREAWEKSNLYTYTIFRDTSIYLNDPDLDSDDVAGAITKANTYYGLLRDKWLQNPANYYTVLNEPAANNEERMPVYAAYQVRMMELAEADGLELCILNLASGTPGDFSAWERHYVPVIQRAWMGDHIYGRHVYGGDTLVPLDGATGRPMQEALYLEDHNINIGIALTECGFNGGYGYIGDDDFIQQTSEYELILRTYPNIIGACMWTLGDWDPPNPNFESATPELTQYLLENPTPRWPRGDVDPPVPPPDEECPGGASLDFGRVYNVIPASASLERATEIFQLRWLNSRETVGGSYDDAGLGNLTNILAQLWDIPAGEQQKFTDFFAEYYPLARVRFMPEAPPPPDPGPSNTKIGLHAGADGGDIFPVEIEEFRLTRPGVIKVMSSHSGPSVGRLAAEHPAATFIVRAFLSFRDSGSPTGMRVISPDQFYNDTISDVRRSVDAIVANSGASRQIIVELHNEPNARIEGYGTSWRGGNEFAIWLNQVLGFYRNSLPGHINYMYPGLSPGGDNPARQGHEQFLRNSMSAVNACDHFGIHLYWSESYPMSVSLSVADFYTSAVQDKPIWVTEASRNDRPAVKTPQEYGREYVEFWDALKSRPNMHGITYFVASASNPEFWPEAWIVEQTSKGIGQVVGNRLILNAIPLSDL